MERFVKIVTPYGQMRLQRVVTDIHAIYVPVPEDTHSMSVLKIMEEELESKDKAVFLGMSGVDNLKGDWISYSGYDPLLDDTIYMPFQVIEQWKDGFPE